MDAIPDPQTLLQASASLAWRQASLLCRSDPASGDNCAWTHGLWPLLRVLDLVGSIESRKDFFSRALAHISGKTPRVLLSGAADYATLAFVHATLQARGLSPQFTVVDLCETPLMLNRWYAEQLGFTIETVRCDIFDYRAALAFDAICTDAFLGRFPRTRRAALVQCWHGLLKPDGLAITVNRIRPAGGDDAVGFTPVEADAFALAVTEAARPLCAVLETDAETITHAARSYADRHRTYPVTSADEIGELFAASAFKLDVLETTGTGNRGAVSGPSMRDGGRYVGVVARR